MNDLPSSYTILCSRTLLEPVLRHVVACAGFVSMVLTPEPHRDVALSPRCPEHFHFEPTVGGDQDVNVEGKYVPRTAESEIVGLSSHSTEYSTLIVTEAVVNLV